MNTKLRYLRRSSLVRVCAGLSPTTLPTHFPSITYPRSFSIGAKSLPLLFHPFAVTVCISTQRVLRDILFSLECSRKRRSPRVKISGSVIYVCEQKQMEALVKKGHYSLFTLFFFLLSEPGTPPMSLTSPSPPSPSSRTSPQSLQQPARAACL